MQKNILIKLYFWLTFALSIFVLINSFGLFLLVSAILIIPLAAIHMLAGIRSKNNVNKLLLLSATNFLLFSLVRCDGVHVTDHSGFSALLKRVHIHVGFNSAHENIYLLATLLFFILQIILDASVLKKSGYKI